jgi:tetratricopeptide (TPR) repeat protein
MRSPDDPTVTDAPSEPEEEPPQSTSIAERYSILSMLGGGGMGRVYLARDTELDELVAVKMVQSELLNDPNALTMLRREVKLARRVTHPNVARTYDIDIHGGQRFITMEYVEGESLASVLKRGPLEVATFLDLARAMCDGLAAAHAAGVVHRDLKPANVLVGEGGRAVITDFGIACLATSLDVWKSSGTPRYMAPEQIEGQPADVRTDIYALGLVFFEMLTGHRPFAESEWKTEVLRRLSEPAPDPRTFADVPPALTEIIRRALATQPEHRYASVYELRVALATVGVVRKETIVASTEAPLSALSIAVLPPRTSGDVPEGLEEHFADTLRTLGLRVPSAAAVAALSARDPREIGRALAVDVVLEIELHCDGAHVAAEAKLIGVADGLALVHRRSTIAVDQLMRWGLRIVSDVGAALRARPAIDLQSRALIDDRETLDLYLQARRLYYQKWAAPNDRACALLERALERKPDEPILLAAFACALARRAAYGAEHELARAIEAVSRTRALAPWSPETYVASATIHMQLAEYEEAVGDLRTALRIAPWHPEAHARIGEIAAEVGLVADAERHVATASTLEPAFKMSSAWTVARLRALSGDIAEADRVMGPPPTEEWLRNQYFMQRTRLLLLDFSEPRVRALREAVESCAFDVKVVIEMVLLALTTRSNVDEVAGMLGRSGGAGSILRRISFFQVLQTELLAFDGRWDGAFESLSTAERAGLVDVFWIDRCALLDAVRSDARFVEIAARVRARAQRVAAAYQSS